MGCTKRTWLAAVRFAPEAAFSRDRSRTKGESPPASSWNDRSVAAAILAPAPPQGTLAQAMPWSRSASATFVSSEAHCTKTMALAVWSSERIRSRRQATALSFEPWARSCGGGSASARADAAALESGGASSMMTEPTWWQVTGARHSGHAGLLRTAAQMQAVWKTCAQGRIAKEPRLPAPSMQIEHSCRACSPCAERPCSCQSKKSLLRRAASSSRATATSPSPRAVLRAAFRAPRPPGHA
mmetsp:Transcript_91203/g.294989  ORF Transcript_91203/g.294989 Transcript_91203/m.294989 type:complete len:241 (-) Transcript_91203:2429-3151(-)